jgi:CBS-domain-containing membrane protein
MISLDKYATVGQRATLHEAVLALAVAHERLHHSRHPHRAVLVVDEAGQVVGKLSMLDVLRALEPRYKEISDFNHSMRFGFSSKFIQSMVQNYQLWQKPLDDLCRKSAKILVKDVMYTPADGEYVRMDATLDEAIHQLVVGHHQSLIVTDDEKKVVGVLRLTDVFFELSDRIEKCFY